MSENQYFFWGGGDNFSFLWTAGHLIEQNKDQ